MSFVIVASAGLMSLLTLQGCGNAGDTTTTTTPGGGTKTSPENCIRLCGELKAEGCCKYADTSTCWWSAHSAVDGSSSISEKAAVANCRATGLCDGWNWGKDCPGPFEPLPPSPTPSPTPPGPPKRWKLVWSDGFDNCPNGRPDPTNWGYEHGYVRNKEQQWYQEDNAECDNGNLVITAKKEQPAEDKSYHYTSSSLLSQGKRQFKHGKYEMRAKIPVDKGAWPAFWVRGADTKLEWPTDGEVDIMEYYQGKVLANFIYGKDWSSTVFNSKTFPVNQSWADQFHVWAMEWDAEEMKISVDGKLVNSMKVAAADLPGVVNPWREFQVYMMVNLAIGGDNGGDPSGTVFPLHLYVDNISFYEQMPDTAMVVM
eukprot:CAMPEP_0172693568 /NCGR_PEP_ID=MMETSP1074-20121228/26079_1 /TAXON_ID=2916 /ORGANISM="Ceratium fusus, Strain PA161109" /LENGTH=369 /DNA_ID=CAMNT_0013513957 /DNA_START=56 /DNA_END=1165 /DNA_ORIENTATION=+